MQPKNPDWRRAVEADFDAATFVRHLGITLDRLEPGRVDAHLAVRPEHLQQAGTVHAGVQTTLADHCAGGAAGTLLGADQGIVSVEFKVHLLRPARGAVLRCRAQVVKPGARFCIVRAEVWTDDADPAGGHGKWLKPAQDGSPRPRREPHVAAGGNDKASNAGIGEPDQRGQSFHMSPGWKPTAMLVGTFAPVPRG